LIIDYRNKYLETLLRGGEDEAEQVVRDFGSARTQADSDYAEVEGADSKR